MIIEKFIGIVLLVGLLLLTLFYIRSFIYPKKYTSKRKRIPRYDYLIIATVPKNKWTEHLFVRIGIGLVDEPYTYLYKAMHINNETCVYKLNNIWIEKESNQETEYSKFIGIAVDNYLLTRKNNT